MILLLEFLSSWLIFTFSLYQGLLELTGQLASVREQPIQTSQDKVSPWLWLLPPVKMRKEKERILTILAENQVSRDQLRKVVGFLDKATGWFYVALGGWLLAVAETYLAVAQLTTHGLLFKTWLALLILTALGVANGFYRTSEKRQDRALQQIDQAIEKRKK